MDAFILVIIMTSGFMFTSRYPLARFKQLRSEGWDQYLHVFAWGLPFSSLSFLVTWIFHCFFNVDEFLGDAWVGEKFSDRLSFLVVLWSALSILFAWMWGYFQSTREEAVNKATLLCANENQFKQRIYEATENGNFVQITLMNRKVYIGYIKIFMELKNPDAKYIKICPFFSGYRTEKRQILKLTNIYCEYFPEKVFRKIYDPLMMEEIVDKILEPYTVVIPVKDIVSIAYWNFDFYNLVNDNKKNL